MLKIKLIKLIVFLPCLLIGSLISNFAVSAEIEHNIYTPITQLVPFAGERPSFPGYANKLLVSFSDMSWIPASCHQSRVYVETTDNVLVSVLMAAFMAQKNVRPIVEDSVMLDGKFCKLVYAFVSQ